MVKFKDIIKEYEKECYRDDYNIDNVFHYYNTRNRNLYLEDIDEGTGSAIASMIQLYNRIDDEENIPVEDREPIKIYINSPGGLLTETFIMIDTIKMSKTPVWGIVTGTSYSGGFFSLLACHKRIGYPHSSYLYHEGSTGTSGSSGQFENYAAFYKRELKKLKTITLDNTKISEELYDEKKREDWWMDAEEALELGIIDEIATELV